MALVRSSLNLAKSVKAMLGCTAFRTALLGVDSTGHLSQLLYPTAMLLSFKTLETETFSSEVRLLLPRADHLLCPASSLSRVYVPLSYSSPGSLVVTLVAIGSTVVSSRMRLPSFTVYLRVRYIFRIPTRYSSASAKCQAPRSLPLALLGAFLAFSSSVLRRFPQ